MTPTMIKLYLVNNHPVTVSLVVSVWKKASLMGEISMLLMAGNSAVTLVISVLDEASCMERIPVLLIAENSAVSLVISMYPWAHHSS